MMLSPPVLLGFLWSLLILSTSGQSQISNNESNKVYAYSYHFQHNGTTNSKDILRSVLGSDPEFGLDNPDGKSIVKTFSSPGIRGFFTKGVLPAGPVSHSFSSGISSPYSAVKKFVESNLQPPRDVATALLPPISPDISREFPGDFNNVNHLGNVFQNQNDYPKIPPIPVIPNIIGNRNVNYPKIPPPPVISSNIGNRNVDFPKIPSPQLNSNNIGNRNIESFSRDTPDGGRIEGHVETFSYNSPPVSNSISRTEENSEGYRRNENILNNNREVTGHRTQSFFRSNFRTVTPNLDSNNFNEHSRVENRNSAVNNNHNNQWWNVLNVLGNNNNNLTPAAPQVSRNVNENINEIQNNINRAFGARLSGFRRQSTHNALDNNNNNRQNNFGSQSNSNYQNRNVNNPIVNQNFNTPLLNQNFNKPAVNKNFNNPVVNTNFNNPLRNQNYYNPPANQNFNNNLHNNRDIPNIESIPFNRADERHSRQNSNNNNAYPNLPNPGFNNNNNNNPTNLNVNQNHQTHNHAFSNNNNHNINHQFNDDTEKKVMNLIHDVSSHLKDIHNNNQRVNNLGPTWDDDIPRNTDNNDWSARRRPFSNGHSGPSDSPQPMDILKTTLDALVGNTNIDIPRNQGNSYRNVDGGGVEKFFGFDRTVEGPNSFSRNQQRGYERDFKVNSNSGYSRSNQWSTNTVRRLDAQSSKADFSTDFIDVFRDE